MTLFKLLKQLQKSVQKGIDNSLKYKQSPEEKWNRLVHMWLRNSTTLHLHPFLSLSFTWADHMKTQLGPWDSEQKAFLDSKLIPPGKSLAFAERLN